MKVLENENEIIQEIKTNPHAFGTLYDFYFPQIYGYIFKRTGNHADSEDIVSEIFLKAFKNIHRYEDKGYKWSTWLYTIATNKLIDFYRKNGRKKEKENDIDSFIENDFASNPDIASDIDNDISREHIFFILEKLQKRHQKILYMKFFGEFSYEEIGRHMQITENNARVLCHRALNSFRKKAQKLGKDFSYLYDFKVF